MLSKDGREVILEEPRIFKTESEKMNGWKRAVVTFFVRKNYFRIYNK